MSEIFYNFAGRKNPWKAELKSMENYLITKRWLSINL